MTVRDLLDQALAHAMSPADRENVADWGRALDVQCHGVTHDSRSVKPGWVFVGLRGLRADGADFAGHTLNRARATVSPPWQAALVCSA